MVIDCTVTYRYIQWVFQINSLFGIIWVQAILFTSILFYHILIEVRCCYYSWGGKRKRNRLRRYYCVVGVLQFLYGRKWASSLLDTLVFQAVRGFRHAWSNCFIEKKWQWSLVSRKRLRAYCDGKRCLEIEKTQIFHKKVICTEIWSVT